MNKLAKAKQINKFADYIIELSNNIKAANKFQLDEMQLNYIANSMIEIRDELDDINSNILSK